MRLDVLTRAKYKCNHELPQSFLHRDGACIVRRLYRAGANTCGEIRSIIKRHFGVAPQLRQ
jgi:hypothetical protein